LSQCFAHSLLLPSRFSFLLLVFAELLYSPYIYFDLALHYYVKLVSNISLFNYHFLVLEVLQLQIFAALNCQLILAHLHQLIKKLQLLKYMCYQNHFELISQLFRSFKNIQCIDYLLVLFIFIFLVQYRIVKIFFLLL